MIQTILVTVALFYSIYFVVKKLRNDFSREAKGCDSCELKK